MHNYEAILREENNLNLMIRLWCKITTNPILNHKLSKFMKLVEIVIVQVFNLVEDECTFNTISFMKNRLQKRLNIHLDLYTHSFSQWFFTLQSFHYDQAIAKWKAKTITLQMCRCNLLLEVAGFFWRIYRLLRKILLFSK
jgi:hypothetical protein